MRPMVLFLAASAALLSFERAVAATGGGVWVATITTQAGKCPKSFQMQFSVRGNDIVTARGSASSADGAIERNGSLWLRLKSGRDLYRLQGRMRGASASGTWSSNTRLCGGAWRGSRRR